MIGTKDRLRELLETSGDVTELVRFGRYCSVKLGENGFFSESDRKRYRDNVYFVIRRLDELGYQDIMTSFGREHEFRVAVSGAEAMTNQFLNTIEIDRYDNA